MRPYVICHMVISADGKVTGDYLYTPECEASTELYYKINREYGADGFACGRVTMEGSFTGGYYPDLSAYAPCRDKGDFTAPRRQDFFAVAFDRRGRLGWRGPEITDEDPGYGGAHIIEVIKEPDDLRYLTYLRSIGVSYIFADTVGEALKKLKSLFGINRLLLEGGSVINGAFLRESLVDELSLVVAPLTADKEGKPLFDSSPITGFKLQGVEKIGDSVWIKYKKQYWRK